MNSSLQVLRNCLYLNPEDLNQKKLKKTFLDALGKHDFWFDRSDDDEVYQRGQVEYQILQDTIARHPELLALYQEYVKRIEEKEKGKEKGKGKGN